jgi:hypothetical protein
MQVAEVLASPLPTMAYSRQKAGTIITGLEDTINSHLVRLAAVASERADAHWRHELETWLIRIARIRLKPDNRPPPSTFLRRILWDEPYGDDAERSIRLTLGLLARDYQLAADVDTTSIAARLQAFHTRLSVLAAAGGLDETTVPALVAEFGGLER